jgi:pyrimidine operon attenuation protein/uracil phosphoribosyltransferase
MQILSEVEIKQKTKRLAIEILEHNYGEQELYLAGINNNGLNFAKSLGLYIKRNSDLNIHYTNIKVNAADPLSEEIVIDLAKEKLVGKSIILVDDVANTGRTLFYAFKPLLDFMPKRIEIAVLVDRKHKNFPVSPTYVGLSLATTIAENIEVRLKSVDEKSVHLV